MIKITISKMLEEVMNDIVSIDAIQASVLTSNNGLMIAQKINSYNIDAGTIAALVAMLTRSAVHTAKELNKGNIEYLLLNAQKGKIIIIKADPNSILTTLTDTDANISLIIAEMKKAREKIINIFAKV
ncbi:MAG: roadblock/LC7 domain-containing protein [ANME-2 cluster archaeon]|nr:roadblock/LC7 domain-containing protein [ANME-2 cluster archaeon]